MRIYMYLGASLNEKKYKVMSFKAAGFRSPISKFDPQPFFLPRYATVFGLIVKPYY